MWAPLTGVNDIHPLNGVIKLWHEANYFNDSPWSTEGVFQKDIFQLFYVPANFVYDSKDTFIFNFGLKYVKKEEKVTGFVIHSGKRDLQEGKVEPFWHLEAQDPVKCKLQTDNVLKIPYLDVPDLGLPGFKPERRYFIAMQAPL